MNAIPNTNASRSTTTAIHVCRIPPIATIDNPKEYNTQYRYFMNQRASTMKVQSVMATA